MQQKAMTNNAGGVILMQHGWGFEHTLWDSWPEFLPNYSCIAGDRGYFGNPGTFGPGGKPSPVDTETPSPQAAFPVDIAVTHSFGLHLLPDALFGQIKLLVIISGFQEFHPNTPVRRAYSRKILHQMIKSFHSGPQAVLKQFHRNCFLPAEMAAEQSGLPSGLNNFDKKLLFKDLKLLNEHKTDNRLLQLPGKVLILHGSSDRIVPENKAWQLHHSLPESVIATAEYGGHMLPVTHVRWCCEKIREAADT